MEKSDKFAYGSVTMFVQNGRSVLLNKVAHGPGAEIVLDAWEARRLSKLGFLVASPPPVRQSSAELAKINPSGIGPQRVVDVSVQGPKYDR